MHELKIFEKCILPTGINLTPSSHPLFISITFSTHNRCYFVATLHSI